MVRYKQKRQYQWSANTAYCVGLMASDGCLQNDGRHLDLTSVDRDQLLNFCKALGRDIKIGSKSTGRNNYGLRVQFSDVAFYDFLLQAGLTPAKSLTMPALNIPEMFYADFLRGYFDGDGSTYGYFDRRWRSSFMFYVQFVSSSLPFINYLQTMNSQLFSTSRGALNWGSRTYQLSYAKADGYKLRSAMYYSEFVPALERKRSKLESFVAVDNTVIMCRNARVAELVDAYA